MQMEWSEMEKSILSQVHSETNPQRSKQHLRHGLGPCHLAAERERERQRGRKAALLNFGARRMQRLPALLLANILQAKFGRLWPTVLFSLPLCLRGWGVRNW
eukprot:EG_transcript_47563